MLWECSLPQSQNLSTDILHTRHPKRSGLLTSLLLPSTYTSQPLPFEPNGLNTPDLLDTATDSTPRQIPEVGRIATDSALGPTHEEVAIARRSDSKVST